MSAGVGGGVSPAGDGRPGVGWRRGSGRTGVPGHGLSLECRSQWVPPSFRAWAVPPGSSRWPCPQRDQDNEILDRNGTARRVRILSLEVEGLGWGGAGLAAVTPSPPPHRGRAAADRGRGGGSPAALTRGKPGRRPPFSARPVDSGKATLFTHHHPGIQLRSEGTQALSTSSAVPRPPQSGRGAPPWSKQPAHGRGRGRTSAPAAGLGGHGAEQDPRPARVSPRRTVLALSPPPSTRSGIPEGRGLQASEAEEEKMWETSCDLRRGAGLGPLLRGPGCLPLWPQREADRRWGPELRAVLGSLDGAQIFQPLHLQPDARWAGGPQPGVRKAGHLLATARGLGCVPPRPPPAVTGSQTVKRDSLGRSVTCWEMDVWGAGGAARSYPPWGQSTPGGLTEKTHRSPQPVPSLCATCDLCKPAVCWVPGAPDVGVASTPSRPGPQPPSLGDTERWGRFGAAWRPESSREANAAARGPGGAVSSVGKSAGEGAHAGCGLAPLKSRLALFLHGRGALLDVFSGSPGWQCRALGSAGTG